MLDSEWSQGYVTDASYTENFFRELSPVWLNYVAALNGVQPRGLEAPFTYLELGCGFGHSAIVNAGAFPGSEFHACDFNPAHIEGGERHAAALGLTNIRFHESSFQDLLSRDLPAFDFIVLHGVYSWVGPEARQAARRIIQEKLKVGGLVYLSYNCMPGWSTEAPLRKLVVELAAAGSGDSLQRAQSALSGLQQLSSAKLRYFTANPDAATAVDFYGKRPSNYLVHEFLNETWEPFYSVDIADEMSAAGVSYVGSATLADNHPMLVIDDLAAETLAKLTSVRQRQLAFDFAANQRFRRDIFVRGPADRGGFDATQHISNAVIGCVGNPARISSKAKVPRGEIRLQEDFIGELQILMAHGSMTLREAVVALGGRNRDPQEIARNLIFLVAAGTLMPFAKARRHDPTRAIGREIAPLARRVLAEIIRNRVRRAIPIETVGNGLEIDVIEALAITEFLAGAEDVDTLAMRLQAELHRLDIKPFDESKELQSNEDRRRYCRLAARNAVEELLPNLTRLNAID